MKMSAQMEGWKNEQKGGRPDRRPDRPYFIGPLELPLGIQSLI